MPVTAGERDVNYHAPHNDPDAPSMSDTIKTIDTSALGSPGCASWVSIDSSVQPFMGDVFDQFCETRTGGACHIDHRHRRVLQESATATPGSASAPMVSLWTRVSPLGRRNRAAQVGVARQPLHGRPSAHRPPGCLSTAGRRWLSGSEASVDGQPRPSGNLPDPATEAAESVSEQGFQRVQVLSPVTRHRIDVGAFGDLVPTNQPEVVGMGCRVPCV